MSNIVLKNREFWIGIIFMGFASLVIQQGMNFGMGQLSSMGPGYFPVVLGILLLIIGLIAFVRSVLRPKPDELVEPIALRSLGIVSLAIFITGWTLTHLGSLIALPLLLVISASGSREVRWTPGYIAFICGLVAVSILLFIVLLKMPIPLFGTLFE
ncbi:tripartite tricarboxylate transporter TctB family protein [Agrobacterium sp. T29]|uniref:tripartite tricarboxylate transporter TctB family protein n=1 Tax=Agrobacterium sp. T29 TaxID=2580515 RepID=UPI00115DE3BB|nr:tripartite tricarboxylate transporter TctB family protein [Agrobacterium sp. T29]